MRISHLLAVAVLVIGGCAGPAAVTAPVGPLVLGGRPAGAAGAYLGSTACRPCHAAAYSRWRATGHARDYSGLAAADRLNSTCLRCHVTGYGDQNGRRSDAAAPDLENVGCEACHGPGADHGRSAHPGLVPTLTGGECPPCEINRVCRLCHTPDRSPAFDLGRDLPAVICRP